MTCARIEERFARLRREGRAGLISFVTAGDPDSQTSAEILSRLPEAGVDLIELGMPFSDPMADGPVIQASSQRALRAGITLKATLSLVARFREEDDETPIVLMGYYNPIYTYGVDKFLVDARSAGVDGLIVVDLPPEEDEELCLPALEADLSFIRLATPTTDARRLPKVLENTSGFLYYVSVTGITGGALSSAETLERKLAAIRRKTDLPLVVGFGIKTPEDAAAIACIADGAVVGSAIVSRIAAGLDADGRPRIGLADEVVGFVAELSRAVRTARLKA